MGMDYQRVIQGRMVTLREEISSKLAEREAIDARRKVVDEEIANRERELAHLEAAYPELAEVIGTAIYTSSRPLSQTSPETDREALVALYYTTDGLNWTVNDNWLSDLPIGTWHGVTTDTDGRVSKLDLGENELKGKYRWSWVTCPA